MRLFFVFFLCLFCLSGCLYYGDLHKHAAPLTPAALSQTRTYGIPSDFNHVRWWNTFGDNQLSQLIAAALDQSPDMAIAKSRVRRAEFLAKGTASSLWPTVDLSGYLTRERFSQYGVVPPPFNGKTFTIGELGLNFNYEFDFWGKNRETLAARVSEECAALADLKQTQLILSSAVASAYYNYIYFNRQLSKSKALLSTSNRSLAIIQVRAQHHIESVLPVKSAIATNESAKLNVAYYQQARAVARNQLIALIGNNPFKTTIQTNKKLSYPAKLTIPKYLPANLIATRPDIQAARARTEAAAHQIKVGKARFFPNINLSALFSYQSILMNKLFDPASQNNFISGAIDLPIFDAGLRRSQLGVNYAEFDEAVSVYNKTIITALQQVADQIVTLRAIRSQLTAQQQTVLATQQRFALTNKRYSHGINDYYSVLELRTALLQAQMQELELQTQYIQAKIGLFKALGGQSV